ncbi:serine hydrolase [Actinomadura graeca]|uniref:Serine hydrolase n=1 Tax=Actinomadura graeca TaxID=2750812 RepID=A0ABX8QPW9_9ACTN|nr:serine hydrolase [Actinomadura graeca]QXJ20848.1 serine hydrolase [Actinomadura graeca]
MAISVRTDSLSYTYRRRLRTATASIVKLDIVLALLLKAQREGRRLTAREKTLAERAITVSDNDAATALWYMIGGSDGLAAANRLLGLRATEPGPGGAWGSTTTTVTDQIRLLTALTSGHSRIRPANRRYVRGLMADVVPEQAWGVSASADSDFGVALKNGWLPRDAHGGLWTINSVGLVRAHGRTYMIAAISERHPSMRDGITTLEHVTRMVTSALAPSRHDLDV